MLGTKPGAKSRAKKATFSLRPEVLSALDEVLAQGAATSKNAFVEQALVHELELLQAETRRRRWLAASQDLIFLEDIRRIESEFDGIDVESLSATD